MARNNTLISKPSDTFSGSKKLQKATITSRIEGHLRQVLRDGTQYRPGNRLPPLRELAEQFGASHTTVDEALRTLEVEGWLKRRARSGVRVALELPHMVIAFVSEEESRQWSPSVAEYLIVCGIHKVLAGTDYRIKMYGLIEPGVDRIRVAKPTLRDAIESARRGMLAGVILRSNPEVIPYFTDQIQELAGVRDLPFVRVESQSAWGEAHVQIDCDALIRLQVEYLVQSGCRRIALYVSGTKSIRERVDHMVSVFRSQIEQAGLKADPRHIIEIIIDDNVEVKQGHGVFDHIFYQKFSQYWTRCVSESACPDGLVITDDIAARSIAFVLLAHQVKVPDQLRVVTLTNKDSGIYYPYPFWRCEIDAHNLGEQAAELVIRQVDGDSQARHAGVQIKPILLPSYQWEKDIV